MSNNSNIDNGSIHNEFSSIDEIKEAVDNGHKICWANNMYRVEKWSNGDYMVKCTVNGAVIGLGDTEYDISRCFTDEVKCPSCGTNISTENENEED